MPWAAVKAGLTTASASIACGAPRTGVDSGQYAAALAGLGVCVGALGLVACLVRPGDGEGFDAAWVRWSLRVEGLITALLEEHVQITAHTPCLNWMQGSPTWGKSCKEARYQNATSHSLVPPFPYVQQR